MTAVTAFSRQGETALYLAVGVAPESARLGLILSAAPYPAELALAGALGRKDGVFVFVPRIPDAAGLDEFVASVLAFLAAPGREGTRFAWFARPTEYPLAGQVLRASIDGDGLVTDDRIDFAFANVVLQLARGNRVGVSGAGLSFSPPAEAPNSLRVTPNGAGPVVDFTLTAPVGLPLFDGAGPPGSLCASFTVDAAGLDAFGTGICYFAPALDAPGYVDALRYPVLDLTVPDAGLLTLGASEADPASLDLAGWFDPVSPLDQDRTYLDMGGAATAPIRSFYRNAVGQVLHVAPQRDAKLVFQPLLGVEPEGAGVGGVAPATPYYLAPAGRYGMTRTVTDMAASGAYTGNVMCGTSASEYITFADGAGITLLEFTANLPAYVPAEYTFDGGALSGVRFGGLEDAARTSWCTVIAKGEAATEAVSGLDYFAQPEAAILHGAPANGALADTDMLPYLPVLSGRTPEGAAAPSADGAASLFPMVAYAGIAAATPDDGARLRDLELQVLAPARRRSMLPASGPALAATGTETTGTTPQGQLVALDGANWRVLTLGMSVEESGGDLPLDLFDVEGPLKEAFQSSRTFLVVSDGQALLDHCSVRYAFTDAILRTLVEAARVPAAIVDAIKPLVGQSYTSRAEVEIAILGTQAPFSLGEQALGAFVATWEPPAAVVEALKAAILGKTYPTFAEIDAALKVALADMDYALWRLPVITFAAAAGRYQIFATAIVSASADLKLAIQGWTFDLSPYQWPAFGSVLIVKFIDKSLRALAADTGAWASADVFNASVEGTQQRLQGIFESATGRQDPDLAAFYAIVDDPNWNGVLALDVRTPLSGLPEALRSLAAGIDPSEFSAHHVGVTMTPFDRTGVGDLLAKPSSLFGLIDYQSPDTPLDAGDGYQFRVLRLKVLFANSIIRDFASRVVLVVNQLFGDGVTLAAGEAKAGEPNAVLFNGVYQKQASDAQGTYSFTTDKTVDFSVSGAVLERVSIPAARFYTVEDAASADDEVEAIFTFEGTLGFRRQPAFDLFSFGSEVDATGGALNDGLNFTDLAVRMRFPAAVPAYRTFAFDAGGIVLDAAASAVRAGSLYAHFPLKVTALRVGGAAARPDKTGYLPVATPLSSGGIGDDWYALAFDLNLGTPGALAAQAGFNAELIAAWSPDPKSAKLFVGLALPGAKGGESALTIQGVLKLAFGDIRFVAAGKSYMLQLRNIALKFLALSLPTTGQTNILLFGDPDGKDRETLGWYAAYQKPDTRPKRNSRTLRRPDEDH
ncbi:MAG: hypothetical protein AAF371_12875 [Pseudomonadota bacterium]